MASGQWVLGGKGFFFPFLFFFPKEKQRENKCTLPTPQLDCVVKHTCYVHSVHLPAGGPEGSGMGLAQGLKTHPQVLGLWITVLGLQLDLQFICVPPLPQC